ncbi:MAG: tail fiber protein [Chloroflexota bacterium]
MTDPFIGEIRIFAGNFAPRGYAFCDGQLLPISQNTALFSVLQTTYGGDGRTTVGLPNLQNRAAMHSGHGPGLTNRQLGNTGGEDTVTLQANQLPAHNHSLAGISSVRGNDGSPSNNTVSGAPIYADAGSATSTMAASAVTNTGGNQPHQNRQPYLGLSFIVALAGAYPSKS